MKYVVPIFSQFQAKELGPMLMGGAYGTQPWWWTEENTYPLAKYFVEDLEQKYHYKPLGSERNLPADDRLGGCGGARRNVLPC